MNPKPDKSPDPSNEDSAAAVWLKLIGLLGGLLVFGFLIYSLSRIVHRG
jgi:hypothetical protein